MFSCRICGFENSDEATLQRHVDDHDDDVNVGPEESLQGPESFKRKLFQGDEVGLATKLQRTNDSLGEMVSVQLDRAQGPGLNLGPTFLNRALSKVPEPHFHKVNSVFLQARSGSKLFDTFEFFTEHKILEELEAYFLRKTEQA